MYTPEFIQDPYPVYQEKLLSCGPIYWDDEYHTWCIMSYELARDALTDPRFSSDVSHYLLQYTFPRDRQQVVEPLVDYFKQWLFYHDPPDHTLLRKQISPVFSQQAIAQYESIVNDIVQEVCSTLSGEGDFVEQVAKVIPSRVIARFLSLPESDVALYLRWTFTLGHFMDCLLRTPYEYEPALEALHEQKQYFSRIKNEQILPNAHWTLLPMLLGTGIETSMTLLSSGLYVLLKHPQSWWQLQEQPELLPQAIDELLRFEPPVHKTIRQATGDFSYHGCDIKKGDHVSIFVASANRDPAAFPNPQQFDMTREPTLHLSFGYGIHYCLGRLLARLVAERSFSYLLTQHADITLLEKPVHWYMGTTLRRLETLPVRYSTVTDFAKLRG